MPRNVSAPAEQGAESPLLKIEEVAKILNCSVQSVRRWFVSGGMPDPLRISSKTHRWSRAAIEQWIAGGCKPVTDKK